MPKTECSQLNARRAWAPGWRLAIIAWLGVMTASNGFADWMPAERYQQMSTMERRQFDGARKLYDGKSYRAAAAEFEKFKIQFPGSSGLAYVVLYQGLSLHGANYRHKAIRTYQEVLDYFGTDVDPAAKALFQVGKAYEDNGDERRALASMQQLADHPELRKHRLAAGAIRRLADVYAKKGEESKAVQLWQQVCRDFRGINKEEASACSGRLANYHLRRGEFAEYADWLREFWPLDEEAEKPELARELAIAETIYAKAWEGLRKNKWKKTGAEAEKLKKEFLRFYEPFAETYLASGEAWSWHQKLIRYAAEALGNQRELQLRLDDAASWLTARKEKAGEDWAYHDRSMWLAFYFIKKADAIEASVNGALAYLEGGGDSKRFQHYQQLTKLLLKEYGDHSLTQRVVAATAADVATRERSKSRDDGYVWLATTMKEAGMVDRAIDFLSKVEHEARRKFDMVGIVGGVQGKWEEAVELLIQVEQINDSHYSPKAREARASVYKNQLAEYAQAISLFYEIDDTPRTLWEIQDCYWRWGKHDKAYETLREIETIFPDQSSKAAWQRTTYYDKRGNKDHVVAEARRILKLYAKSRESSQAHQLLEKYGIATGGGVDE